MLTLRFTAMFLDRPAVMQAVERGRLTALRRAGALVRLSSQHSMRRRRGPSPPGSPPHAHAGLLRQMIYYAYDPATRSVVVGPLRFARSDVPRVLEHGGWSHYTFRRGTRRWRKRVYVAPRPYMRSALAREGKRLAGLWADVVV